MSVRPPPGTPVQPPRPGSGDGAILGSQPRPSWGEIDALLGIAWFVGAMVVASIVGSLVGLIGGGNLIDSTPVYALFFGTLAFQILQVAYPWLVSKRKGLGIAQDWRFVSSLPSDIFIGFVLAMCCFISVQVATVGSAALVGLENTDDAANSGFLVDNRGSMWIVGLVMLVVVGAPLAEELLFRGLLLRVFQQSFGSVFAVVASSLLFALPHWQSGATWQETVVLLCAIGTVGVVLGTGAVVVGRLGPSVIGHFFFNAAGAVSALAL